VVNAPLGLDESPQKVNVTQAAIAFNELMPMIPLFERYGNNPSLEGTRVAAWPPDTDPVMQNAPYGDNFTIMLLLTGDLRPV
jgi:peptide/nickel transport system substrate-binding protein